MLYVKLLMKNFKTMPALNKNRLYSLWKQKEKVLVFVCNLQKKTTFFHKLEPENFFISEEYIGLIYKLV